MSNTLEEVIIGQIDTVGKINITETVGINEQAAIDLQKKKNDRWMSLMTCER